MLKSPTIVTGQSTKRHYNYKEADVTTEVEIEKLECDDSERNYKSTTHVSQLKGYYNSHKSDEDNDDSDDQEVISQKLENQSQRIESRRVVKRNKRVPKNLLCC